MKISKKLSQLIQLWFRHFVGGKPSPTRNDPDYSPSLELGYVGSRPKTKSDKERFQRHMKRTHIGSSTPKNTLAQVKQHDEHIDMIVENNDVAEQDRKGPQVKVKEESDKVIDGVRCPAPGCQKTYKRRAGLCLHWWKFHEKEEEMTLSEVEAKFVQSTVVNVVNYVCPDLNA